MANRFSDSRKWDDPWFRKLPCKYKAFWLFILDKCDHAGIWKKDFESASFHIGEEIIEDEIREILNGRIKEYGDKWFITKFVTFQYGNLNPDNRVHASVIMKLEKEGLTEKKEKKEPKKLEVVLTEDERKSLVEDYGATMTKAYIDKLTDYAKQFPDRFRKYSSHLATIRNWMRRDGVRKIPKEEKIAPPSCDPKVAEENILKLKGLIAGVGK